MCYNCGCQNPQDDMGDPNNITKSTLTHLSQHWGKSLEETKVVLLKMLETGDKALAEDEHLKHMFDVAGKAWGQSLEEAKKNTHDLLKKELTKSS